jgi:hypothetical protein
MLQFELHGALPGMRRTLRAPAARVNAATPANAAPAKLFEINF